LIGPADTRGIFFKGFRQLAISQYRAGTMRLPSFCPDSPKIPFFCRAVDTPWGLISLLGLANGEIAKMKISQMKIKGNGRSALILAAGLCVCFAGPSQAATGTNVTTAGASSTAGAPIALNKYTRHSSRHWRRYANHKSSKEALKSTDDKKTANTDTAADDADKSSTPPTSEIPTSVANANAQLAASDSPTSDVARAMSVRANNIVQNTPNNPADTQPAAESQVVAPDQLNDVDRALHEASPSATPLAVASAEPPAASAAAPVTAGSTASSSDSTWDKTSLIGKIFIGFGALLTMASAARMFMA
jgi:hypothetical protein